MVNVEGARTEGTGQPEMSLQRKVKAYMTIGRPKEITNAPGLWKVSTSSNVGRKMHIRSKELVAMRFGMLDGYGFRGFGRHDELKREPIELYE